jgi:acyl-CoA thioester hydrolase
VNRPERAGDPARAPRGVATVRVRYPETDQMGVAHHTHFLVWFEIGRTELLRERGCAYADLEASGVWMPVVEVSCRYHRSARYDDELRVETTLDEVTRVTARFTYRVLRAGDGMLLATGSTRHAATDRTGTPRRMPDAVHALLAPGGEGRR